MIREWLHKREQQARRMGQMMQRLGVDVEVLATQRQGQELRQAMSTCAQCDCIESCDRSMADWQAGRKYTADPTDFCPNSDRFAKCCDGK